VKAALKLKANVDENILTEKWCSSRQCEVTYRLILLLHKSMITFVPVQGGDDMFESSNARDHIEQRNAVRAEAHLPLLSVETELHRLERVEREREFNEFFETSPLRAKLEERMLARFRRSRGEPEWRPTGFLSGGGLWFYSLTRRTMHRLWRLQKRSASRTP
jgi:hypothetical protein